jgi:stress-induced morphogen
MADNQARIDVRHRLISSAFEGKTFIGKERNVAQAIGKVLDGVANR